MKTQSIQQAAATPAPNAVTPVAAPAVNPKAVPIAVNTGIINLPPAYLLLL